jgi:aminoglycoside phosphotransferase (APT) family kinase protein
VVEDLTMSGPGVSIDVALVSRLIAGQFPEWADLPLRSVESSGADNALFRLGEELVVRLPRVDWAAGMVAKEQRWLPRFSGRLPLDHPEPMGLGEPASGYPWTWGVYRWLKGRDALADPVTDDAASARSLAGFLARMRGVDTLGGPAAGEANNYRGVALRQLDRRVRESLAQLEADIDTALAARIWNDALEAGAEDPPGLWVHGDLHPGNLLVRNGTLAGVLDFGSLGVGDPAVDLMAAWTVFEGGGREAFVEATDMDREAWRRARGWALYGAVIALPYYRERNPVLAAISRRTLGEVLEGSGTV